MRMSPVRAVLFGALLLAGCEVGVGDVPPGGGGDDDGISSDDGISDDGISVDAAPDPDPTLRATVDRAQITTELMSESMVTLTLQGGEGFAGPVNVAATVVDNAGATLTGWTIQLSDQTVTLPTDGSAQVVATIKIPSEKAVLTGNIKFVATSALANAEPVMTAMTVTDQITIPITRGGGGNGCQYPAGMTTTRVKVGTKVRFLNADTDAADVIRIHMQGGDGIGLTHQGADMGPGQAYERTADGTGAADWYCHTPGNDPGNLRIQVVN